MLALKCRLGTRTDGAPLIAVLEIERRKWKRGWPRRTVTHTTTKEQMLDAARYSGQQGLMWLEDTDQPASRCEP